MPCFLQKNDPAIGVYHYPVMAHLRLIRALQHFSLQIPPCVLHPQGITKNMESSMCESIFTARFYSLSSLTGTQSQCSHDS